jgi:hypothetical protein
VPPAAPPPPGLDRPLSRPLPPQEPYEPWRLPEPRRQAGLTGRPANRRLFLGAGAAIMASLVAAALIVLWPAGGDPAPQRRTTLAAASFPGDPAAPSDGRHQVLYSVAAVGGTVVAVGGETDIDGSRSLFLSSTDGGRTFQLATVRAMDGGEQFPHMYPRQVAGGPAGWVALGQIDADTAVWTSKDGRTWIRQPGVAGQAFRSGDQVARVFGTKSGFIAVGSVGKGDDAEPLLWRSADGESWERLTDDRLKVGKKDWTTALEGGAAHDDTIVVTGLRERGKARTRMVWTSTDGGDEWTEAKVPTPKHGGALTVAAGSGGFLLARQINDPKDLHAAIYSSRDGADWEPAGELEASGYQWLKQLLGAPEGYTAVVGSATALLLLTSTDGETWQQAGSIPREEGRQYDASAAAGGQTITVGRDYAADINALLDVRDRQGSAVPVDVAKISGAVLPDRAVRAIAAAGGRLVAVGSGNGDAAVWTSADGSGWQRGRPEDDAFARPGAQRLYGVAPGGAGWLAIGVSGFPGRPHVISSADGVGWRVVDDDAFEPGGDDRLVTQAVAAGSAGYAVVGDEGDSAAAWYSADLKSWERGAGEGKDDLTGSSAEPRWMRGVAAGSAGFVAVGGFRDGDAEEGRDRRPAVWTSADGAKWAFEELPLPSGVTSGSLQRVAAHGQAILAVGNGLGRTGVMPLAYLSADGGKKWQPVALPGTGAKDLGVSALVATPQGFAVAGVAGRFGSTDVVLWRTADNRTWTVESPREEGLAGNGEQTLYGGAVLGGELVFVGRTSDHRNDGPLLWRRALN